MLVLLDTGIRSGRALPHHRRDVHEGYLRSRARGAKSARWASAPPPPSSSGSTSISIGRQADASVKALFTNIRGSTAHAPRVSSKVFDRIQRRGGRHRCAGLAAQVPAHLRPDLVGARRRRLQPLPPARPQQRQDDRDLPGGLQESPGASPAHTVLATHRPQGARKQGHGRHTYATTSNCRGEWTGGNDETMSNANDLVQSIHRL